MWQLRRTGMIAGRGALDAAAGGGANPFSLISSVNKTLTGTSTAIDTTGANLLIVAVCYYAGGVSPVITDSKSNTWTPLTARLSTDAGSRIFYSVPSSVGASHTFSCNSCTAPTFSAMAWSGANGTPFDVENGATGNSGTSCQPGSVTPAANNSLLISCAAISGSVSSGYSTDNSFVTVFNQNNNSGTSIGCMISYLLQSSAAAMNPTTSWSVSGTFADEIAVFKS